MVKSAYDYPVTDYSFKRRLLTLLTHGDWMARIIIESLLIVFSILAALAVSEWQDSRENEELAHEALVAFEREIRQNKARLEDAGPYRQGLRQVLERMGAAGELRTAEEFHAMVGLEPLRPPFLTSTVWQTSLTTGAIPHIRFDLVNALSFTYSLQERLSEFSRSGMPVLARGGSVPPEQMPAALREVLVYLADLNRSEAELLAAYEEVLRILHANGITGPTDTAGSVAAED